MRFALAQDPVDYQITVHYNNYIAHFGNMFKDHMDYVSVYAEKHEELVAKEFPVMYGLLQHYGYAKLNEWVKEFIMVAA